MLKKIIVLICLLLCCGCRPINVDENANKSFKIVSYKGTPSLALLSITNENYDIDIVDTVDKIDDAFNVNEADIIIAPINTGVSNCQNGTDYKLYSIVEYGNLFLVSTDEMTYDGYVGAYGQDSIVGYIVNYLSATDLRKYEFIWYDNFDELKSALLNGEINTLITDEVNFNNLVNYEGIGLAKIENIQDDYAYKTGYQNYPFYAMFVKSSILENNQNMFVNFAKNIKSSITTYKTDKTTFNEVLANADLEKMGFNNPDLISESYNYCGLDFVHAINEIENIKMILGICDIELDDNILVR